jgi:RNA polymerase sigma-B factor
MTATSGKDDEYECFAPLLAEYASLPVGSPRRAALREQLIVGFFPVVEHLARRYAGRGGESIADLRQVGAIGLINAIDRFDPDRGVSLLGYAIPTITGELKRYFRDRVSLMRVPRRVHELYTDVQAAVEELAQTLGRAPRPSDIATHLGLRRSDVLEFLEAQDNARMMTSLDEPLAGGELTPGANLPDDRSNDLDSVEYQQTLKPLVDDLPERERTILMLRFFGDMSQREIGQALGISQMHVSRLLARTLAHLRHHLVPAD